MEEIYMNVGPNKSVFSCSSTNQTGPWGSERRFYRAAVLCLGLLSFFLLTGLTGLGVHLHRAEADFSIIKANMTELLEDSKNKWSSLTEENDRLNSRLSSLNAEKDRLNSRLSSLNAEKDRLNSSLSSLNAEKDRLNSSLSSLNAEKDRLNSSLSSLTAEKDRLNSKLSSLTAEKDRLNASLRKMTEDRQKKTCPAGWTMFSFSCYFLSDSGSWTKGREDCRRTDADLVIIDSAEEQNFLSGFAKEDSWIGLSDGDTEGTWKWTDGTPLTFKNWGQYEPNNGGENGNEDCVQIRAQKGVWNDLPCGTSLKSICEK